MRSTILILILFLATECLAQNTAQVRYNYDAAGNANFMAENYAAVPAYIALDFSYLRNASFSDLLPYIKRVDPGSTTLFTIYREPDMPAPDFNIEYKMYFSNPRPQIDPLFPYLIPAKQGTEVEVIGARSELGNRPVAFVLKQSDEVFASRKGVVIRVSEDTEPDLAPGNSKQSNYLEILHDDGTIGKYLNFAYKGIDCGVGQKIFPGQRLGKAAQGSNGLPTVAIVIFHQTLNSNNLKFITPEFYTGKKSVELLTISQNYQSVHPAEIIEKELSKKERKSLK